MGALYIGLLVFILTAFAGIAVYIYRFSMRIVKNIGITINNIWVRVGIMAGVIAVLWLFTQISSVCTIIFLHFIALSIIVDVIHFIVKKICNVNKTNESEILESNKRFRYWNKVYKTCLVPIVITVVLIGYGYFNMMNVVETDYTVNTNKNIREEGYRVGLIADLHYGVSIDIKELEEVCSDISSKHPDIMVLCGDIVDEGTSLRDMQAVFNTLGEIDSTYGIYYVYGNHDRQTYKAEKSFTTEQLEEAIISSGITILCDDVMSINDEFVIVGREDASFTRDANRISIEELLKDVDKNDYILTLDHQPNEYEENEKAGTDLLLSGHTHAGQVWPANLFLEVVKFNDAVYGITEIGDFTGLVTSGIAGWAYPIKTSAPAEYVIIDIVR